MHGQSVILQSLCRETPKWANKGTTQPTSWENTKTSLDTEVTHFSEIECIFLKESYAFKYLGNFSYILTHQRKMNDWLMCRLGFIQHALESFSGGLDAKVPAYNEGDPGSIPGLGRSPGEGNGSPLQYSCLENPMDGGAW